MKKQVGMTILCLVLTASLLPFSVFADEDNGQFLVASKESESVSSEAKNGLYLPDVTAEMSNAEYWAQKEEDPDEVLSDWETIQKLNSDILNDWDHTQMFDLKTWPYDTYDGNDRNSRNQSAVRSTLQSYYNSGVTGIHYDKDGNYYATEDEIWNNIYNPIIANAADPNATANDPVRYAICTKRTTMMTVPSDEPLWEDYTEEYKDLDNGNNWVHPIRVNEPLLVLTTSADGKYCLAYSTGLCDWVPTADIAFCKDKEEWLAAWDLAPEKTLVVYADKIYTEMSYSAPETSKVMLTMGTCLELADEDAYKDMPVINRWAYNNHVVWLPVRKDDGSYTKVLALIGENKQVSEGYLPITTRNILSVALNQLGDTYGWGGMLESEDCSGFMRDVYKCFGMELAKNTTWQAAMPVYKQSLSEMKTVEKAEYIRDLPPGAILVFRGHEMMYLGEENGKLYVISSVGSLVVPGQTNVINVRGGLINTLDVLRGDGTTWLENLHTALIPYYPEDYVRTFPLKDKNVTLAGTSFPYTGKAITPKVTVTYKNRTLVENTDYTVAYANNKKIGTGTVTVTGTGKYSGTIRKTFSIVKAANPITVKAKKKVLTAYAGKNTKIKAKNAFVVRGAKGTVSYKKRSGNKKITVAKNGTITVKNGLKKGNVYKVKVRVIASGNDSYKKGYQDVVLKIKIK